MQIPNDFYEICNTFKNNNTFSVNCLRAHYKTSPPVIKDWLEKSNIQINKSNTKLESLIDLEQFMVDIKSKALSFDELIIKYNITKDNIKKVCKRNNINYEHLNGTFEPNCKISFIDELNKVGKQATAKKYGITLSVVSGWCIKNNIVLPKHHGRRRNDVDSKLEDILTLHNQGYSVSSMGVMYNTSAPKISRLLKLHKPLSIITKFEQWEVERALVRKNIEFYSHENISKDLKTIATEQDISYEVLKTEFKNCNIPVQLHSYNRSKGELALKEFLASLGFQSKSIRKTFNNKIYEIDCFIEDKQLGIEYCGEYWHSVNKGTSRKYHQDKFLWAKDQGIHLITIFEHEWYSKSELIKSMITHRLGITQNKIYARNTEILIIANEQAKIFHNKNHISGGLKTSSINLGLFNNGELVSVASFSKSRLCKTSQFELLRYSTELNTQVIGGFGKLFSKFKQLYNPKSLVSFCDLRFGSGLVYQSVGFNLKYMTPPNYWYYYKKDGVEGTFESRIKYQKHKLKQLDNFNIEKTEYQIMDENGYLKIYDCGNYKYVYEAE